MYEYPGAVAEGMIFKFRGAQTMLEQAYIRGPDLGFSAEYYIGISVYTQISIHMYDIFIYTHRYVLFTGGCLPRTEINVR